MYLALQDEGVFRSADAGRKWIPLNDGLTGKRISAVAAIGNSVFIGTNQGLYRLNLGVWDQLPVDPLKTVHSMAVFENNLYVVTGPDFLSLGIFGIKLTEQNVSQDFPLSRLRIYVARNNT